MFGILVPQIIPIHQLENGAHLTKHVSSESAQSFYLKAAVLSVSYLFPLRLHIF